MPERKQEQNNVQDEHTMVVLDKRTNNVGVVSKMNEKDGTLDVVSPDKKNSNSFIKLDKTTPLELFFSNFKNQYDNPTSFSFFLIPLKVLEKTMNAIVQIRKGEDPGTEGKRLVENSELNDEGRIAKLAKRYKFDEHQLPWKELSDLGFTKEVLFNEKCMGELLKGRITSVAFPLSKEVDGKRQDLGEACLSCVKMDDGTVKLNILSKLDAPQFENATYKKLFTDAEKEQLQATGALGGTKEMKDISTGKVCKCYIAFHKPTNRIMTMPVDAIKIPDYIYGKRLDDTQKKALEAGSSISLQDIQRKNGMMLSGTVQVDAARRDVVFKQADENLKISDTIMGARISPEQKKILEAHGMIFVENMRNPRNGKIFSDDIRFSNTSNNLLIGKNAREYNPNKVQQKKTNATEKPKQVRKPRNDFSIDSQQPKKKGVRIS